MNTDPLIEVTELDVLAYKKDRATVIGQPLLVLMLNPICDCVLNKAIVMTEDTSDPLAAVMSSWRLTQPARKFVVDDGREFCSQTFANVFIGAGCQIQYRPRTYGNTLERIMMHFTQRIKPWQLWNWGSTPLTLAEIKRSVWKKVVNHNKKIRKGEGSRRAEPVYKVAGIGISRSIRRAYFNVLQASLECGFDAEQVSFIWQTAGYSYSADQLRIMFEEVVSQFHSTKMYDDYYHTDVTQLQSLFKPPIDILEGEGAVAIRTLAQVKAQYDKKAFIWSSGLDWARPIGSWADLTYALLERLVKDGLATDSLRCKLFARDLGM